MNIFKYLIVIMFIIVMQVYAEKELSCEGMEGIVLTQCEKAMKGDLEAMYNLGAMYQVKGKLGEEPNYEKAITWLKKAAEGGNAAAMISSKSPISGHLVWSSNGSVVLEEKPYDLLSSLYSKLTQLPFFMESSIVPCNDMS